MPLAKIHMRKGHRAEKKRAIADAVQASLIATLDIPEQDRFQLIEEYEDDHFIHTDGFLGLTYTRDLLMIEIALTEGRSDALKTPDCRTTSQKASPASAIEQPNPRLRRWRCAQRSR
jgi:phenylpyruvate tautomerase PptA (4-oxalocrotonate tautomerase family)